MPRHSMSDSSESSVDWMLPAEAASALGVTTKTLTRMASDGRLRAHRVGNGHRRYRRDDVDRLLAESGILGTPNGARVKAGAGR